MNFFSFIVVCALCALVSSFHEIPERAKSGRAYKEMLARVAAGAVKSQNGKVASNTPLTWNAPVDHFSVENNSTFAQRYYVDDQFWNGEGPVFYYISGEGTCNGAPSGYVATLGAQYSALLIALEHRFYGESIPNGNALSENYKYLSVEQALADLAGFTNYYKSQVPKTQSVPWVVFGGSYSGALSSWYRTTYPDLSIGSLASSGVVNCIIDFYQFDMQVCFMAW